jgi:hypothetical protein
MKTNTLYFIVLALLAYFAATLAVDARPTEDRTMWIVDVHGS